MDGVNNITYTYGVYSVEEAMRPPQQEGPPPEEQQMAATTENINEHQEEANIKLIQPGRPIEGLGPIKFRPINGQYAFREASPIQRMQYLGYFNFIRNVNLYTIHTIYRGIGSIIDIRI